MKKLLTLLAAVAIGVSLTVIGCGPQKAASSKEAIDASKAMQTVQAKTDYLVQQAKAFYNSKDFQQAVDVAQYVLAYVDKDSQEAKTLLDKAKEQLAEMAKKQMDTLKSKMPALGK